MRWFQILGQALIYQPAAGYYGPDQFTFTASDGFTVSAPATVSITVVHVNKPPVGGPDEFTVEQSGLLVIRLGELLANDWDPEGDPLEVLGLEEEPMHGGIGFIWDDGGWVLGYNPEGGFSGDDTFTYVLSGGNFMVSVPVTIHVIHVNHAPSAYNDEFDLDENFAATVPAPGVLGNDIDSDGDTLTVHVTEPPVQGTLSLNTDGGFTYVPDSPENHSGADGFWYVAFDGALQSTTGFVLLVSANSDGPLAVSQVASTHENEPCQIQLLAAKTDGSEVFEIVAQPTHGWVEIDPWGEGDVIYFPNPDFYGDDLFTFRVGSSAPAPVKIRVEGGGILRWRHDHFGTWDNAGIAADSADPDGDGSPNLLEYALVGNPLSPETAPLLRHRLDALGRLELTFTRREDPEVTLVIEGSETLADGSWTVLASHSAGVWNTSAGGVSESPDGLFHMTVFTDEASLPVTPRRFLRLQVTTLP